MTHVTRSIRFPTDVFEQLEKLAEREDRTINSLVVHLVRRGVDLYQAPQQSSQVVLSPQSAGATMFTSSPIAHGADMGQIEPASGIPPTIGGGKLRQNPTGPIDTDSQR